MARDYEDLYDLDNLDDDELEALILEELGEYPELDPDLLQVRIENGFVRLEGRVGTEQELQEIDHVLSDVIGLSRYANEAVVDELVRGERSEAADEEVQEERELRPSGGDPGSATDPGASHLLEDVDGDLYGTSDHQQAVERGQAYEPPERPQQEGTWSKENH